MVLSNRSQGARLDSVQTRARATNRRSPFAGSLLGTTYRPSSVADIPAWGHPERDRALLKLWRLKGLEPIQAATAAISQKVQSTGWYIEGARRVAARVHNMLHNADFGMGWETFLSKFVFNYLNQDGGVFVEIIGDGDPTQTLTTPVLGIAVMDSTRCYRTGDPDYPVLYRDMDGVQHKMHWSRIWYQADMPTTEEGYLGIGYCALSRCVATAQGLFAWSEMRNERFDDFPPAGILALTGINKNMWEEQYRQYEADRQQRDQRYYRGVMTLFQANPSLKLGIDMISFRQLYEGFDERRLYDTFIDLVAMAYGIDRQEIAALSTSALGSGAQSSVLERKARGKGVGNVLSLLERFINRIIPDSVRFSFDFADDEQDMQQAQIQHLRTTTILALYTADGKPSNIAIDTAQAAEPSYTQTMAEGGLLSRTEARYLLAREGVIPRDLLHADERLNPGWEQFDEITRKFMAGYGESACVTRAGKWHSPHDWQKFRREQAQGVCWT